eukprot:scaffold57191_cov38-Prasinocladus_malaysianus.AAC.1
MVPQFCLVLFAFDNPRQANSRKCGLCKAQRLVPCHIAEFLSWHGHSVVAVLLMVLNMSLTRTHSWCLRQPDLSSSSKPPPRNQLAQYVRSNLDMTLEASHNMASQSDQTLSMRGLVNSIYQERHTVHKIRRQIQPEFGQIVRPMRLRQQNRQIWTGHAVASREAVALAAARLRAAARVAALIMPASNAPTADHSIGLVRAALTYLR